MYKVLDKDSIMTEIAPYLPIPVHGPSPRAPVAEIVNAVLYKLKSGAQWHMLPVSELFTGEPLHYKTVFGYYRKWCKGWSWKDRWVQFLSSGDLDGSHTTAIRGGENVEYQGRKKRKTTNALYPADRQGLPLAMSEPVPGNHNDLYEIEVRSEKVFATLEEVGIATDGLFVNGDAGLDLQGFRSACHKRGVIPNVSYDERKGTWTGTSPSTKNFMEKGIPWKGLLPGWTASVPCSTGSTPPHLAGKGSISLPL